MREKLLVSILAVFVTVILAACSGGSAYELKDELSFDEQGYDGYGELSMSLDREKLAYELKKTVKNPERFDESAWSYFIDTIDVTLSKTEDLSNGDKVDLALSYDEDNAMKIKLKLAENSLEISELEAMTKISAEDVFEGVTVEAVDGVAPFATVLIEKGETDLASLFDYELITSNEAELGNYKVEATANTDLLERGYDLQEGQLEKEFTIDFQEKYALTWDELKEDDQAYVKDEVMKYVTEKIDSKIDPDGYVTGINNGRSSVISQEVDAKGKFAIDNIRFLTTKGDRGQDINNIALFHVKSTVKFNGNTTNWNKEYKNKTADLHTFIAVEELILDEQGNLIKDEIKDIHRYGVTNLDYDYTYEDAIRHRDRSYDIVEVK